MNSKQRRFVNNLVQQIPKLFAAIERGNYKSELVMGVRTVGDRQVRLKLVAEVLDSAADQPKESNNPLA